MDFTWIDYDPAAMAYIEDWLDEGAVKTTGLDEGFCAFYTYWVNEEGYDLGENFWCKVILEAASPVAVIALGWYEGKTIVMELVVKPEKRGRGIGSRLLKELLAREEILGFSIQKGEAVIFPGNIASQKAFEKAGFRYHHTHPDGDALYYVYEAPDFPM